MIVLDDAALLALLREDVPYGDLTTRSLGLKGTEARMTFQARDAMTVCGVEEAARLLTLIGCHVDVAAGSGDTLAAKAAILAVIGPVEKVMIGWKVAQTLVEWASGVATAARRLVDAGRAVNPDIVVACTRKAIPGTRALSAKAILAGGAVLHRTGLSDTLLLFPEHRQLVSGEGALQQQITALRRTCPERSAVVEVVSIAEACAAARVGADVLQLEKFPPEAIADLLRTLPSDRTAKIAAAGGINASNVANYARTGVEILVTSAPYYAKPADVNVTISR